MVADSFRILDPLYDAALDLPLDERTAFLDREVPTEFRESLDRLLAAAEADDPLLDRAPVTIGEVQEAVGDHAALGEVVGPYRITGLLGEGGMGRVYRAERVDGVFDRTVALKLVRRSLVLAGADVVERLRRERAVLASLEHPNIARLYGGGETDDGVPWVAMELVDGVPITAYAERRALTVRERVALFVDVCRAVEHAHRRLVVHRDLKPSNVLVAEDEDGRPVVKLLDFGIARLLDHDAEGLTRTGTPMMTPEYAAPEQLRGGEITTVTDVWALGALLYEVLTGARPYTPEPAAGGALGRIAGFERAVRSPPPPPSQAAHSGRSHALRDDLDAVVLQALRPEAERRYASAGALADDLSRFLDGHPVAARPASRWYLASAFVRRNRGAVAAAAAVVVALAVGLMASLLSLGRERDARAAAEAQTARAEAEAARADAAFEFVVDLFGGSDGARLDLSATTADLLAAGTRRAAALGHDRDAERAVAFGALREVRHRLDQRGEAWRAAAEAARAARRAYGPNHPHTLDAVGEFAVVSALMGDVERALTLLAGVARHHRARGSHVKLARLQADVGAATAWASYQGVAPERWMAAAGRQLGEAEAALRAAGDSVGLLAALNGQAHVVEDRNGIAAAVPVYGEAYRIARALHGNGPGTLSALNNWGDALVLAGRAREGAPLLDSLVAQSRRAFGPGHPSFILALVNASFARLERGHPGDVEQALEWTAEADQARTDVASWTASATAARLVALRAAGRWRAHDERAARALGAADEPSDLAGVRAERALSRLALGDTAGAVRLARAALRDADGGDAALAHLALACVAAERGDASGTRAALDAARHSLDDAGLPAHGLTRRLVRAGPSGGACEGWVPGP